MFQCRILWRRSRWNGNAPSHRATLSDSVAPPSEVIAMDSYRIAALIFTFPSAYLPTEVCPQRSNMQSGRDRRRFKYKQIVVDELVN